MFVVTVSACPERSNNGKQRKIHHPLWPTEPEDTQKTNKTDDSNSIQNQKLLLEKYAAEKGFTNTLFLYDDGYSGTNFAGVR